MSFLTYTIFSSTAEGRLVEPVASGTIAVASTPSAPIPVPRGTGPATILTGRFRVFGSNPIYLETRADNTKTVQTSAHIAVDRTPRVLISSDDGAFELTVHPGGTLTAVLAEALTPASFSSEK